ncbi:uncharacterized protein LOC128742926 [Sabethes cyaneus]|uniref:uncharacterized protein LOC128742926 n=1 Tax=Sabethes cyaneus TaxID=53552 RepID=UPI00237DF1E2|nr:uncharacterized protein LOC128742926 [Sabethes cyaneus]
MKPPSEIAETPFAAPNVERNQKLDKSRVINPHLVLLKATLFLIFGAFSSLVPYLTVHMQSIGLTVGEIATVYLTLLFTTCLCPPISGYIVDRFGQYKPVLMVCLVLNIVAHHSLDLIPRRQPFELVTVRPRLVFLAADKGNIYLDQPCSQSGCPTASVLQQKLRQDCPNAAQNNTPIELIAVQSDNSNRSCGSVMVDECILELLVNSSNPPISVQCELSNEYDRTFWYYLMIRFCATTMLTATVTIVDPMALTMIEQHGGDFGREKLFSSLGMAIFTPLTGLLIDYFSDGDRTTNYQPAFYTYDILMALSLIAVLFLPIGQKLPSENIMKHLFEILQHPHVLVFIFFLFFMGSFWGFIESYMFVIMKEMGSPNYLLGLTYTVGTVTSVPMMYLTNPITRKVGHVNLLVIAFFAHATRILGYSFIHNPFWCFPIELNEAISCYFMWVVATTYCAVLAPNSLVATLIGVAGMAHFCLGKGVGSFAGGFLIAQFGTRMAFRYMGYFAVCCGLTYKFLHLAWLKKYDKHQVAETEDHGTVEKKV